MNNYILIILDSCRYDSFIAAAPTFAPRLGQVECRWSYASWTGPSHYNLMSGLLPHTSPSHIYASEYYKEEFLQFNTRFGVEGISFKNMVPEMYLPTFLKNHLGYETNALVSMPVLNPKTTINRDFDRFELMPKHNDMRAMLPKLTFSSEKPSFYLLNIGETHYPYALPDENPKEWPRISGVHGVFKKLDDNNEESQPFFNQEKLDILKQRQIDAVRYLDDVINELLDLVPENTFVTVTADHGELFGEAGYFGHGPIQHDKVFEVPFVEGLIR
jgi:sulfatase-like protein